jgi:flagellar protein FlgJ
MAIEHIDARPGLGAGAVTDLKGLHDLKAQAAQRAPEALEAVAQQFEALFLGMMLDSMRAATIEGGLEDSGETQLYQQLFDRQVASNISEGGGLGLARMLVEQLSDAWQRSAAVQDAAPAAADGTAAPDAAGAADAGRSATAPGQFIREVLPHARRAAAELGVHPMALVAQAALETGWGGRLPRRADGESSMNLFGVKAGADWRGTRASAQTLEFEGGLPVARREQFRAYDSMEGAFADYVRMIKGSPRYAAARAAGSDPERYAQALQVAGYATDPDYAAKIRAVLHSEPMAEAWRTLAGDATGSET